MNRLSICGPLDRSVKPHNGCAPECETPMDILHQVQHSLGRDPSKLNVLDEGIFVELLRNASQRTSVTKKKRRTRRLRRSTVSN